jgi:tetraacyldisaccharide-1-P 4'-kinase
LSAARADGAEAVVMTEKDAVKWPLRAHNDVPVYALHIEMSIENETDFLSAVTTRLFRNQE